MRFIFGIATLALALAITPTESHPASQQRSAVQWQKVDQLCGVLESETPRKKTITASNGRRETRLYSNVLNNASIALYRGTASDRSCCGVDAPVETTKSNKRGWFELRGAHSGWYWLLIERNNFRTIVPLHVTSDYNDRFCHDRSVGRIFTVDSKPPKVEVRIC
jgi:hypothetical protein